MDLKLVVAFLLPPFTTPDAIVPATELADVSLAIGFGRDQVGVEDPLHPLISVPPRPSSDDWTTRGLSVYAGADTDVIRDSIEIPRLVLSI